MEAKQAELQGISHTGKGLRTFRWTDRGRGGSAHAPVCRIAGPSSSLPLLSEVLPLPRLPPLSCT